MSGQSLQKLPIKFSLRRKRCLLVLGLPTVGTRWEAARARIRDRMARARREGNLADQIALSQIKAYLKRVLHRSCGKCGRLIDRRSRLCGLCSCVEVALAQTGRSPIERMVRLMEGVFTLRDCWARIRQEPELGPVSLQTVSSAICKLHRAGEIRITIPKVGNSAATYVCLRP